MKLFETFYQTASVGVEFQVSDSSNSKEKFSFHSCILTFDLRRKSCQFDYVCWVSPNLRADSEKINYARFVFNKAILNSCIKVGQLSEEIKKLLNCSNSELKFSMDNMIKNRLAHPEVTDEDYSKIPSIIKSPSKYYKSKSGYDVILFKADEKYYKLVIKTTKIEKKTL